jgi:hypothetical protein
MQGVKREKRRDTARVEHWTRVLFDTCVTSEMRPGNQTESSQIKNLLKALSLEKALGLAEVVESPRLPGAFGGELGTRRAVHRRTWSSSQASLSCCGTSKRSFMLECFPRTAPVSKHLTTLFVVTVSNRLTVALCCDRVQTSTVPNVSK